MAPSEPGLQAGLWLGLNASQLAQVAESTFGQEQVGVVITGPDSGIQHANQALAGLLGCKQEELPGKVLDELVDGPWQSLDQGKCAGSHSSKNSAPVGICRVGQKSGGTITCQVNSRAIRDENGKVTHFLVFFKEAPAATDAAQTIGIEKELCRSQALQTLGMLAGGVAHDFNNALEVILGFASLARVRLSSSHPLHEPLKIIEVSAKGAADLARRLLDVSREDTDKEVTVDAGDMVAVILSIITRTFDRKIQIEPRIAERLPSVKAHRSRLQQAILNLCINARDAMPKGGNLCVEAALQTIKEGDARLPDSKVPGQYVRIAVRDTGEGMSAEVMKKIFVPQFTTKGRGYGLGLAMVDQIVKEAQGFISVTSQPGKGSEFSVYLPAVFEERPRAAIASQGEMIAGRGRVLVVDDEPRVLEFLEKGLTRLGYDVVTAENGGRACEIYSQNSEGFSCVLLDLIMPGMGGLETYSRLKAINPGVKVILSSGYSSGRVKQEAVEAGNPDFLDKPFTLEELSQALQKVRQN